MRFIRILLTCVLMLTILGCEESRKAANLPSGTFQKSCIFTPSKISLNQLTEFSQKWQITAYIDILDQFNSRMKTAGIWRFELYAKVPRSADPMGDRVWVWPDFELTLAEINNNYWQDYLRCYKFELNLNAEAESGKSYILQAICFTADGRRLTDTIELKP